MASLLAAFVPKGATGEFAFGSRDRGLDVWTESRGRFESGAHGAPYGTNTAGNAIGMIPVGAHNGGGGHSLESPSRI